MQDNSRMSRFDGATQDSSGLSTGRDYFSTQASTCKTGLNWTELVRQENGGPGESPGRLEAIERTKARTAARYEAVGFKKAKGTSTAKPKVTVSRDQVRKAGW